MTRWKVVETNIAGRQGEQEPYRRGLETNLNDLSAAGWEIYSLTISEMEGVSGAVIVACRDDEE